MTNPQLVATAHASNAAPAKARSQRAGLSMFLPCRRAGVVPNFFRIRRLAKTAIKARA